MSMAPRSEPIVWQGAADRVPAQYVAIKVGRVYKDGGGLFGIGNSPSLVGALPDARIIEGTSVGAGGVVIKLRVPGGELPRGLAGGSRLVLGLVDPEHVICLLMPPADLADDMLPSWAAKQRCG